MTEFKITNWKTVEWPEVLHSIRLSLRWGEVKDWNTLKVTYELPLVERLWQPYAGGRLSLHRIHAHDKESLVHPHPWPSRMLIVSGSYEMSIGRMVVNSHSELLNEYEEDSKLILTRGSCYSMFNPKTYHSVRVIGKPVLSIMLTGEPYENPEPFQKPPRQPELTLDETHSILCDFNQEIPSENYYHGR